MEKAELTVAVIGASTDRSKYGNKSVRAHAKQGWRVFPVHPSATEIEGHAAYKSLAEIPESIHRVSLYLPPAIGIKILPEIVAAAPEEFFVNPGAESDELLTLARELGLKPIQACSIVEIGTSPMQFPD